MRCFVEPIPLQSRSGFRTDVSIDYIQPDQINMSVCFCYFVKSDLSSLRFCTRVNWKSPFSQGTRNTRPCLSGHPVLKHPYLNIIFINLLSAWSKLDKYPHDIDLNTSLESWGSSSTPPLPLEEADDDDDDDEKAKGRNQNETLLAPYPPPRPSGNF